MKKAVLKTELGIEKFHYEVEIFISTFGAYESYSHTEEFADENLKKAKFQALKRAQELELILKQQGMFFLPFASPDEFILGKNACYSISVSLIQEFDDEDIEIHTIEGEDLCTTEEALLFESEIFDQLAINQN
jgi:hypothetical protein